MRFRFQSLHELLDAERNFDQIESAFSPPSYGQAPSNPTHDPLIYFDTTLAKMGYYNPGTAAWVYW